MPRDPYEVLGVRKDATDDDIKKAYRKLARQHHPDRNPGDKQAEATFKEVQDAYDLLSDKTKRSNFDRFGHAGPQAGFGGWGQQPGGPGFQEVDPAQAEEIFRQFFGDGGGFGDVFARRGGSARRTRTPPPREAEAEVQVPFATAALGGTIALHVDGKELNVKIPAGVESGKSLRLQGQAPGGGDLLLKLLVQPHPYFVRENNDLVLEVPISIQEAVLGAAIEVPTLDGSRLTVKVPPGTSSGARLRLRGKGIHGGDQYVKLKIAVPKSVEDQGRKLIEEFASLYPQNPRSGLW